MRRLKRGTAILAALIFCLALLVPWTSLADGTRSAASDGIAQKIGGPRPDASASPRPAARAIAMDSREGEELEVNYEINPGGATTNAEGQAAYQGFIGSTVIMAVRWTGEAPAGGNVTYTWVPDADSTDPPILSSAPEPSAAPSSEASSGSRFSRAANGSARTSTPPENYNGPRANRVTAVPTRSDSWTWLVSAWQGDDLISAIHVRLVVPPASLTLALSPNDSTVALGANVAAVPTVSGFGEGAYTVTVYAGPVGGQAVGSTTVNVAAGAGSTTTTTAASGVPLPTRTAGTTTYTAIITRQGGTTELARSASWSVTVAAARLIPVHPTVSIFQDADASRTTLSATWDTSEDYMQPAWADDPNAQYVWTVPENAPAIAAEYTGGQYLTNSPTVTLADGATLTPGTYVYSVQALLPSASGGQGTPISAPAANITLKIYSGVQLVPTQDVFRTDIGQGATLSVEWVAHSDPTNGGGTRWTPEAGAPGLVGASASGVLEAPGLTATTVAAATSGTFHYHVVPYAASGQTFDDMGTDVTLVVAPASGGQPTAISYTLPYPDSATTVAGTVTDIIEGQSMNLPTLVVDPDPVSSSVAWYGPRLTNEPPEDFDPESPAGTGNEFQLQATTTLQNAPAGSSIYYFAVISNQVGSQTLSLSIPFTIRVQARGEQSLVSTTNNTPEGTDIPVLANASSATTVSVAWLPGQEPSDISEYHWTVSQAPSGGTFTVHEPNLAPVSGCTPTLNGTATYTVGSGSVWTTPRGVLSFDVSAFTAEGRYIISYEAISSSGARVGTRTGIIPIVAGAVSMPTASGQYTYSIEKGYFPGTAMAPIILPGDYPSNPVTTAGGAADASGTNPLVIGPQGMNASGVSTTLDLNDRVELYWNPENITVQVGSNREPLNNLPGTVNYWENWVSMIWRCRPSQQVDGGGNALTIPINTGYSGVNSPLLVISPLTADMEGWEYALEIHIRGNEHLYTTTPWVHLDINGVAPGTVPVATLTSYPAPSGSRVVIPVGGQISFMTSVQSSIASENMSYQWESQQPPSGSDPYPNWVQMDGANSSVLTFSSVSAAQNGVKYRCRVVNVSYAAGATGYTDAITLEVREQNGSIIFASPIEESLVSLYAGRTHSMSVSARTDDGSGVSYQWYVKSYPGSVPGGQQGMLHGEPITTISQAAAYVAASGSTAISGATSPNYTTDPLPEGVYQFTCRVENQNDASNSLNSEAVYIVVTQESRRPYISTPTPGFYTEVGVENGRSISMTCDAWVASGEDMMYQWQTTTTPANSSSWADLASTSPTLTIATVTETYSGSYYRCLVGNPAAGEARVSGYYHLNVWNVANVPVVQDHPVNVETHLYTLPEVTIPNGATVQGIQLTCSATVAQSNTQGRPMTPIWYHGDTPIQTGSSDSFGNHFYVNQATTADGRYLSYLTVTGMAGNKNAARAASGEYRCVWYKPQLETSITSPQPVVGPLPGVNLAPQASSSVARVVITVPGDPSIATVSTSPQRAAVGTSATFTVSANLAANSTDQPQGSLVYTWQMTEDGGATWRNCLSADGSGQYTSSFTTAPLTRSMYNNSTASNVPGAGSGTPGNADTVYMYRCIVANRTTGARVHTANLRLIVTDGTEAPPTQSPSVPPSQSPSSEPSESASPSQQAPSIQPGSGPIHLTGSGSSRYLVGPTATRYGYSAEVYLPELNQTLPSGYSFVIQDPDGYAVSGSEIVGTGMTLYIRSQSGTNADSATIVILGDVRGTGVLNITQLVAIAQDVSGERTLTGPYAMAADLNGNGRIDIGDLVLEARLLS